MAVQMKKPKLTLLSLSALFLCVHVASSVDTVALAVAASHCSGSLDPDHCVSTLVSIPELTCTPLPQLIASVVNTTAADVHYAASDCASLLRGRFAAYEPRQRVALADCLDLFDQTESELSRAVSDLSKHPASRLADLNTVLSAAITNQYSCLDGFAYVTDGHNLRPKIESKLFNISRLIGHSLAMAKKIPPSNHQRAAKKEAFREYGRIVKGFPEWISADDRQLLTDKAAMVADLVVAKDGSGNFTTIMEAVNATANHSKKRIVIYIKAGAYFENVEVVKTKTNLLFVGDGIGKTVVKASRNVLAGWTTYRSATVAIVGNGFLARDLTIENSAGPSQHQAVALRNNADLSAFYRCSFVGYQDTLYVHSMRQFYRNCDVYGTVDFVFGNAAAVLQGCNLYAQRPDPNQKNIFTAQGREDPNQNTGISIQRCKIAAAADLVPVVSQFKSYLGRPWKKYSRTVVMQSEIDGLIEPAGWLEWNGSFALDTLYYGEYMNRGPGANTTGRVKWPGYRVITSSTEASKFTVGSFIQGAEWLPATSVPFTTGLN